MERVARRLSKVGLDAESVLGIVAKLVNSGSYFVSALLSAVCLSPSDQGLFFTFLSLVTLTVIVELGLNTVVIQFISHELSAFEHASGEPSRREAQSRLRSIGRFAFIWFWLGAAVFLVAAIGGGFFFFADVERGRNIVVGPWGLLALMVSADLALFPCWSILEGARRIKAVYLYRSVKAIVLGLATWGALLLKLQLWSLPIGFAATFLVSGFAIASNWSFLSQFLVTPEGPKISWSSDMLPLQWRLAVSWTAGYFSNWAITPIALKLFGATIAGQIGMTWALATGITTVASSVIFVKFAAFGKLVALRQFKELDRLALRQGLLSISLAAVGGIAIVAVDWWATKAGLKIATRALPPVLVAFFMAGTFAQQLTVPMATYLRAFKREPYLWLSVIGALLFIAMLVGGGLLFGVRGVAIGYFLVMSLFGVPVGTAIFLRCRSKWTMLRDEAGAADLAPAGGLLQRLP